MGSSVAILLFSPLFLIIAIAIKLESDGPIFYTGVRLGRGKKKITVYKFRTMCVDADIKLKKVLANNSAMAQEWRLFHKLKNDPRVTRIGTFLRRTSLDELPQFICVLKGDLSLVGPRAYIEDLISDAFDEKHQTLYADIFSIKPGLTCLWQISGRSELTYEDRLKLDSLYSRQKSLIQDMQILLKTFPVVLKRQGAV